MHIIYVCLFVNTEYDAVKARSNLEKYGVSFKEAATSFLDDFALSMEDPSAEGESRWALIGMSNKARLLTVIYTLRRHRVRLISARKASKREAKYYA